jgi:hypothetical protein
LFSFPFFFFQVNINEQPILDPVGPFYFVKLSAVGTEIGTLTTTDPDANLGNGGTSTGCCASFTYTSVTVTKSGEDNSSTAPDSDIVLAASTGIITVGRATITTSAGNPTKYILTAKVKDHSGSEGIDSENVAITIEVSSLSDSRLSIKELDLYRIILVVNVL